NNVCNGTETCLLGSCIAGVPFNCVDNNPCTNDSCDPLVGCVNAPVANGTTSSDGNVCNGAEVCQTGTCQPGTALNCADTNPCTADTCDPSGGCQHTALVDGASCDDGTV